MAEEVSAEILRLMRANFMYRVNTDAEVRAFLKKLREKKATQGDVSLYSVRLGELLREVVRDVLTAAELPNETLYYNIMQDTVGELLKGAHRAVNDAGAEAQRAIDEQNGVGLAPISADFPQRRVNDLFYKAGAPGTTRERALKLLDEPLVTLTQSFHDDHVRVNAEARYRAGMAPKIVRTATRGCCKWCASLEGSYPYEDVADTGNDVFRRHERCRCTVDYVCDGKAQNVWTKRERPADAETLAARRAYGADEQTDAGTLEARREYGAESGGADAGTLAARQAYGVKGGGSDERILTDRQEYRSGSSEGYEDITTEWTMVTKQGSVTMLNTWAHNGVPYVVDGRHVVLKPSKEEQKIAQIMGAKYGKDVMLVPKINWPEGIQTPDYLIDQARYDLKSPTGAGKSVMYGLIASKKRQADNFIVNITNCPLPMDEIERQTAKLYRNPRTAFVKNIVLLKDGRITKVFSKK